jgi:hypothetical protein
MTYLRRISLVVVALLAPLIAVSRPASATSLVNFRAVIAETQTVALCPPAPSICVTITGSGEATHLGHFQESALAVGNLASNPAPGCHTETRNTTLTAANGDQIMLYSTGVSCSTGPTTGTASDTYQVVGGTGRFSGAGGSGTMTAQFIIAKSAVATFSGLLSTPGSL